MTRRWRERLLLLSGGLLASGLLAWIALDFAERIVGIRDPQFLYENRLDMWQPDADIGFVNAPDFAAFAWGSVEVRTDARGFRAGSAKRSTRGVPLIAGIGDSVMWGTGVDAADSLLGQLVARLIADAPVDGINAGVVGYSSLQELRFLEKFIMALEPDVVLLNLCNNDLMASEDPFGNVREIHAAYLEALLGDEGANLDPKERSAAQRMIALLRANRRAWPQINAMAPEELRAMTRLLVERPILEMARLVRKSGGRLVLVIIPPRAVDSDYARTAGRLSRSVRAAGGDVLDLTPHLQFERPLRARNVFGWLPSMPALERILRWRGIQATHAQRDFLDAVHPSRRGNAAIADRIAAHLRGTNGWRRP